MGNQNPKLSPKDQMREHKRQIRRAGREIERERNKLQQEEKKQVAEIKKLARQNQMGPVRIMAKDLVRTRSQVSKMYNMSSQLKSVEMKLQTMQSTQAMAATLGSASQAMLAFNKQMNLPEINKMVQEFSRENQRMEMTEEMMADGLDLAFGDVDDVEATDEVVNQVLGEIGIQLDADFDMTPSNQLNAPAQEENKVPQLDDLESRFNALK